MIPELTKFFLSLSLSLSLSLCLCRRAVAVSDSGRNSGWNFAGSGAVGCSLFPVPVHQETASRRENQ